MKNDKVKHFLAGVMVSAFVGVPTYLESMNLFSGLWACLAAVLVGATKEWTDYMHTNVFDWRDFGATCIGAAIVAVFIILLHFGRG